MYYLSFCDVERTKDRRWIGACYVEASEFLEAITVAHRPGCNPGGDVLGVLVPESVKVRPAYVGRLLTREEVEDATDAPRGSSVWVDVEGGCVVNVDRTA